MTIKECIDIVDTLKPNAYTVEDKVRWLSFIEAIIINEVLKTHEGYDGRYDLFEGYSADKLTVTLIVPSPHDRLYTAYLQMHIDRENGESSRYNNSVATYNAYMTEYRKYYNKTHMPLDVTKRTAPVSVKKHTVGLTDAEYENIKRDLFYMLSEHFADLTSPDKLYDIVKSYAQNNVAMLKGKDGKDGKDGVDGDKPVNGVDYNTPAEKEEFAKSLKNNPKFTGTVKIGDTKLYMDDYGEFIIDVPSSMNEFGIPNMGGTLSISNGELLINGMPVGAGGGSNIKDLTADLTHNPLTETEKANFMRNTGLDARLNGIDANISTLGTMLGEMDVTLDEILEAQESLIGGDGE